MVKVSNGNITLVSEFNESKTQNRIRVSTYTAVNNLCSSTRKSFRNRGPIKRSKAFYMSNSETTIPAHN